MKILFTGHGKLWEAYNRVRPESEAKSFRLMSEAEMEEAILGSDVIIHNSANKTSGNPDELMRDNYSLTVKILRVLDEVALSKRFIYIGSMAYLHEHGYIDPEYMSPYAKTKYFAETQCRVMLPNMKAVRFATIFYKDDKHDALSKIIKGAVEHKSLTIYNSGNAKRDIIPIDIAAQYLDYAIHNKTGRVVNICSGTETTFFQLGKIISRLTGAEVKYDNQPMPSVLSKFKRTLPEIPFDLEAEIKDYIKQLKS